MRLLEVYTPEVEIYVRYKVMDPADIDRFVKTHKNISKEEYIRAVLETIVFNLRSDISDALRKMDKTKARTVLNSVYNGCIMLNPGLDVDSWIRISQQVEQEKTKELEPGPVEEDIPPPITEERKRSRPTKKRVSKKITKTKYKGLRSHLKKNIIGQDEAIDIVADALKRSIVGLGDEHRPIGVFLFSGASGVGKTLLAKELHKYLFDANTDIVRIDCGEYQHKHENQKLIGAPPGYVGHESGGYLANQMKKNPHTVVLLDEVEKAHEDLWNTFLRVFDEGMITDGKGSEISFKDAIIIMTTNLGNKDAVDHILDMGTGFGRKQNVSFSDTKAPKREAMQRYTSKAIQKSFTPEFLNRIDRIVVFNHLNKENMINIAALELDKISEKLKKRNIALIYDNKVCSKMIEEGVNPVEGARGLSKIRREVIEDALSDELIRYARWPKGTKITLSWDNGFKTKVEKPSKNKTASS